MATPATPYVTLQAARNGGAPASGGITCAYSDSIVLSITNTTGISSVRYLIVGYPPGWALPSGWTAAVAGDGNPPGSYYLDTNGAPCPAFTLPAATTWGKWILKAYGNGNGLLTSTTLVGLEIVSANVVHDIAPGETTEFSAASFVYDLQRDLRKLDTAAGGGGGGPPTGAAGGDLSGTYPNPGAAKINGTSVPAGGALTAGNAPYVSGIAALTYSALNLAGGAGWVTGALPLANLAAGSTGQILGPTPNWTSTPSISGLLSADSIGGYTAQAFRFSTLSKSVAGGVNVTLSTTEAQSRNITFTGAISADIFAIIPAGTTLVAGSEYILTNSTTSTTPTTAAWLLNFKYATTGTGLWLTPGVPVRVVWTGSDFIYGEGSFAGGDLVVTVSLINASPGNYSTAAFAVPAGFHLTANLATPKTTVVGGNTVLSCGTTAGGFNIITNKTVTGNAPLSGAYGIASSDLGTDMVAGQKYSAYYGSRTTFFVSQVQSIAACTAGSFTVTFRGYVVPV